MILSGKAVAEALQSNFQFTQAPRLVTLRVGEQEADIAYEAGAGKKLALLGLEVEHLVFPQSVSQSQLDDAILQLNQRKDVQGILVFQPLPSHLNASVLPIAPEKDVDCSTFPQQGRLVAGVDGFLPGAPAAVLATLAHYDIPLEGKNVTLIGRSTVVGRPLALLLMQQGATVTVCHSKTKNLASVAQASDILITSAGKANLITADFVHPQQIVIDISTNMVNGKLQGDIHPEIHDIVAAYTPTPGGIGAVCTTILAQQVVKAATLTP